MTIPPLRAAFARRQDTRRLGAASICDSQSLALERFQRDLLRQHDVPGGKCSVGREAPSPCHVTVASELLDVHCRSAADPVAGAGVGAHHVETLVYVILFGLVG
jgi:hypothetical protein